MLRNFVEPASNQDALYHVSRLSIGKTDILLPQGNVVSIESVYELHNENSDLSTVGSLYLHGRAIKVYCLSPDMKILTSIPPGYSQCVVIRDNSIEFALLCEHIKNMQLTKIRFEAVPHCMLTNQMPWSHLSLYSDNLSEQKMKLGLVTHAELLDDYIKCLIQGQVFDG